jgi:hypothetical protein
VEVSHESLEVEAVQKVRLHESMVCRSNLCTFMQPCQLASVGQKVLGVRL